MKQSRRTFINRSGKILAAGTLLGPELVFNSLSKEKNKILIGGHPWVFAADLPGYDITPVLEKIFQDMKYANLDCVELMHNPLRDYNVSLGIKDLITRYGLPVIGTSYGADMWNREKHREIIEDVDNITNNLAKIGGKTFGTSVGHPAGIKTEDQLDAQAEVLLQLQKICAGKGIVLNLHNHTYEVENGMHDLKGTLKRIPDIKLGPDINWLIRGGVDPVSFINQYGAQIVFMHLRDQDANGKWTEAIGEGVTNFKEIGKALKKSSFSGQLVIELAFENDFFPTRPIKNSLLISRNQIKKVMKY